MPKVVEVGETVGCVGSRVFYSLDLRGLECVAGNMGKGIERNEDHCAGSGNHPAQGGEGLRWWR